MGMDRSVFVGAFVVIDKAEWDEIEKQWEVDNIDDLCIDVFTEVENGDDVYLIPNLSRDEDSFESVDEQGQSFTSIDQNLIFKKQHSLAQYCREHKHVFCGHPVKTQFGVLSYWM